MKRINSFSRGVVGLFFAVFSVFAVRSEVLIITMGSAECDEDADKVYNIADSRDINRNFFEIPRFKTFYWVGTKKVPVADGKLSWPEKCNLVIDTDEGVTITRIELYLTQSTSGTLEMYVDDSRDVNGWMETKARDMKIKSWTGEIHETVMIMSAARSIR